MRSKLTNADIEEFRRAVGQLEPLKTDPAAPQQPPRPVPPPAPPHKAVGRAPAPAVGGNDGELSYCRSGLQDRVFRKLRRGQFSIEGELDLHGYTLAQADAALCTFLDRSRAQGKRCVRVIHGKGLRSPQGRPTIRHEVGGWLRRHDETLAFCPARPEDGGAGAVYVLLRAAHSRARRRR